MFGVFSNLKNGSLKGDNGSVLVIGGSYLYAGAPAFTAQAALRCGADLVYILTSPDALIPLKSLYNVIVLPFSYDERILDKITACVVGPGLDRCSIELLNLLKQILIFLDKKGVAVIVDGDAIHYYKNDELIFVKNCIITPNFKEAHNLKIKDGNIGIFKGEKDKIIMGNKEIIIDEKGSNRRCGGQGDILAGVIAAACSICNGEYFSACADAARLVRRASRRTFKKYGYGMLASDIITNIYKEIK